MAAKTNWTSGDYVDHQAMNELGVDINEAEESDEIEALEDEVNRKQDKAYRGTVATAIAVAAKICTLDNASYVPQPGDLFIIEFTAGNGVAAATLNINSSGALPITGASGSTASAATVVPVNGEVLVLHDTTTYRLLTGNITIYSNMTDAELDLGSSSTGRLLSPVTAASKLLTRSAAVPTAVNSTGRLGQFAMDTNFMYVCVATNSWRRIALSSW